MRKKLARHGTSLVRVIERPSLDLLEIDTGTPPKISTVGMPLIVSPLAELRARNKKFDSPQEWAHKRYGKSLEKLAK